MESATNQMLDTANRAIVDTNLDLTNIVDLTDEKSRKLVCESLDKCVKILEAHCGPHAGYAMLVNNYRASAIFEPNVFTRDGIKTLTAVEFMSPLQKYIQELLTYIGGRVDDKAKDGTTTSMLFAAKLITKLLESDNTVGLKSMSIFHVNLIFRTIFKELNEVLHAFSFDIAKLLNKKEEDLTEEEKTKCAGKIAFIQALSSSGGNVELAQAMKKIFENSPSISWDSLSFRTSRLENGSEWNVEVPDYDYQLPCIVETRGVLNSAGNSELLLENPHVIVSTMGLNDGNMDSEIICNYLESSVSDDYSLIIITPNISGRIVQVIDQLNQIRKNKIIAIIHTPGARLNGQAYNWDLDVLAAISGIKPIDNSRELYMINNIKEVESFVPTKVLWRNNNLFFYGVIKNVEENCKVNPYYLHPETATECYRSTLATCQRMLEDNRNGHMHNESLHKVFTEALNDLICVRRPFLRLGGGVHDQVANMEVANDVLGAIQSSLKHGFLVGGPLALSNVVLRVYSSYIDKAEKATSDELKEVYNFAANILKQIYNTVLDIVEVVYEEKCTAGSKLMSGELTLDHEKYINALDSEQKIRTLSDYLNKMDKIDDDILNLSTEGMELGTQYPVFQPIDITKELLKRTQELLLKFAITNKIVVAGGVVAGKLAKQED